MVMNVNQTWVCFNLEISYKDLTIIRISTDMDTHPYAMEFNVMYVNNMYMVSDK